MPISVEQIQPMIGTLVKLLPEPQHLNAKGKPVPLSSNEWRIESVGYKLVVLKNGQTGHSLTLGETNIRDFGNKRLTVRFQLVLKTKNTIIMGF
jgi:hypothetical protein